MNTQATTNATEDVIDRVRQLMPINTLSIVARPLTWSEARTVAERQAMLLLQLLGITRPSVEIERVLEHSAIEVESQPDLGASAYSDWVDGRWLITMNASDNLWRCRATLAHEVKHILDDPYREVLYPGWDRSTSRPLAAAEQICDYFAGCILVPSAWLVQAWQAGTREPAELASMFDVSEALLRVRLRQVSPAMPRGGTYARSACTRLPRMPQLSGAQAIGRGLRRPISAPTGAAV